MGINRRPVSQERAGKPIVVPSLGNVKPVPRNILAHCWPAARTVTDGTEAVSRPRCGVGGSWILPPRSGFVQWQITSRWTGPGAGQPRPEGGHVAFAPALGGRRVQVQAPRPRASDGRG